MARTTRTTRTLLPLAALATAVGLGACTGQEQPVAPTGEASTEAPAATSPEVTAEPTPDVPLGESYPVPDDLDRALPESVDTLEGPSGQSFDLTGVHRLGADRVVVSGVVTLEDGGSDTIDPHEWREEGYPEISLARGFEFAPFVLTVEGDEARYLPVRAADDACLCSVLRPGFQEGGAELPVMTVMSAPADAESVDLEMPGFGELTDVPVAPIPDAGGTSSAWGKTEALTVRSATRADGVVTARVTVGMPEDASGYGYGVYNFGQEQLCFAGLNAAGATSLAGKPAVEGEDCVRGVLPAAGEAVDLEVSMPDPGTDELVLLPWNGYPVTVEPTGEPQEGSGETLVAYDARTRTEGATVAQGQEVSVSLDTSVLFDFGESTLTSEATETLAVAVEALEQQEGRSLTIEGHTDTQGEEEFNQQLSVERAEAVRDALAGELGEGWTFSVEGYGEEQLLVEEQGGPEEVEEAQARNRRVEITVGD